MSKPIIFGYILLASCLLVLSCGRRKSGYYLKNQWQFSGFNSNPLKAKPLEIKESMYVGLDDTILTAKGKFNSYDLWRFDRDGNLSYRIYFQSDSFWIQSLFSYDKNGSHLKSVAHVISPDPNIARTVDTTEGDRSILLPDGRIRIVGHSGELLPLSGQPLVIKLISFSEGGNIEKVEFMSDSTAQANSMGRVTMIYDGQTIKKIEGFSPKEPPASVQYFYSSRNFLDSIVSRSGDKVIERQLFTNSEFGDPLRYLRITKGKDTSEDRTMQYEYDKSGNWIKMLEKMVTRDPYIHSTTGTYQRFSLSIRQIVYPNDKNNTK